MVTWQDQIAALTEVTVQGETRSQIDMHENRYDTRIARSTMRQHIPGPGEGSAHISHREDDMRKPRDWTRI